MLRVISSSPGDIQPVLEIIGERAEKFCEADISVVSIVDGELSVWRRSMASQSWGCEAFRAHFRCGSPTRRSRRARSALVGVCHIADVLADPQYQAETYRSG